MFTIVTSIFTSLRKRLHTLIGGALAVAVGAAFLVADVSSADAQEQATPVAGSFSIGGGNTGEIDERKGVFRATLPVLTMPGINGGSVDVGLSYSQESAENNRFQIGKGWGWAQPFIEVDGSIRVHPTSGGVFEADESWSSGLSRYTLGDVVFSQKSGVLPVTDQSGEIPYAFSMAYTGGVEQYFNESGDMVAQVDSHGFRTEWVWDVSHRLLAVVDNAGSRAEIIWETDTVSISAPQRSDTLTPVTTLKIEGDQLVSVTDPVQQNLTFKYIDEGVLEKMKSASGAETTISYQTLNDNSVVVDQLRVTDSGSGSELSVRKWSVIGDRLSSGYPSYPNSAALWVSGDPEFRYQTQLSDGKTKVVSNFNSLGLMAERNVTLASQTDDFVAQEQKFEFLGTENGQFPTPPTLPKQYQKPTTTNVIFHDNLGGTRQVTEHTVYDDAGRAIKKVDAEGTVIETVYDTEVPNGLVLPVGLIREQTTTGADGTVTKTVNTLTPDHKNIHTTETFTGTTNKLSSESRTEFTVEPDGFVSEERIVAVGHTGTSPDPVVTRFTRNVNPSEKTVSRSQITAPGTATESTTTVVSDLTTGLPVKEIDPTGRTAKTQYDRAGRVVEQTDYAGRSTVTEYGKNVTRVTDPLQVTRSEYVDVLGQVLKSTDNIHTTNGVSAPEAGFERLLQKRTYENNSSKIVTTDEYGLETVTVSDVFGRPLEIKTPTGIQQISRYDDVANTVTTGLTTSNNLSQASVVTQTRKDEKGRTVEKTATRSDKVPVPQAATQYDGLGRVAEKVGKDLTTAVTFNPDGTEKTTTITPTAPETFPAKPVIAEREHNLLGSTTQKTLTQPGGETRDGVSRVVNAAGNTVSETDQTGKSTFFTYTADGLVTRVQAEATGVVTTKTYDSATRQLVLAETRDAEGTVSATAYEYDPIAGNLVAVFDPSNRAETQITYTYDIFGNKTEIAYPDGKKLRYTFDEHGRQTSSTDIAGNVTTLDYNRFGFLTHATQKSSDNTVLASVEYDYDKLGRVTKLSRSNGVTTEYTFTSVDQIKTEKTTHQGTLLSDASYVYDTHGNLAQRVDNRHDVTPTTETQTYKYDAYNRLIASSVYDGDKPVGEPRTATDYQVNVSGDVVKETVSHNAGAEQPQRTVREFEYTPNGLLTAITTNGVRAEQHYDDAGNLTQSFDGTRYTYNVYNQPLAEKRLDGTTVTTSYWANGHNKTVTTSVPADAANPASHTVGMYWDDRTLVNETHTSDPGTLAGNSSDPSNTVTAAYLFGTSRHARTVTAADGNVSGSGTQFYVTDRHENVTALTGSDGQVTESYSYSDYGTARTIKSGQPAAPRQTSGTDSAAGVPAQTPQLDAKSESMGDFADRNPFQYSSEYTTPTGAQLLGVRVYDSLMMRFTTEDSAALHNLYAYANANPITFVDPTGQSGEEDTLNHGAVATIVLGFAFILLGFAPLVATGISANLMTVGIIGPGLLDLGLTAAQAADVFTLDHDVLSNELSEAFTWVTFASGLVSLGTGIHGLVDGVKAFKSAEKDIAIHTTAKQTQATEAKVTLKSLKKDKKSFAEALEKHTRQLNWFETKAGEFDAQGAGEFAVDARGMASIHKNSVRIVKEEIEKIDKKITAATTHNATFKTQSKESIRAAKVEKENSRKVIYAAIGMGVVNLGSVVADGIEGGFMTAARLSPDGGKEIVDEELTDML